MKVLLINPPITLSEKENITYTLPLGLAYLASVVRGEGYLVDCLDALIEGYESSPLYIKGKSGSFFHYGLKLEDIGKIMEKERLDVIGISCPFTIAWGNVAAISRIAKDIDPEIKVIVGGAHPSALPQASLTDTIDFVVVGEGEQTFIELLNFFEQGSNTSSLQRIKGIAFKRNETSFLTPPREPIKNLDELPFPARDLFPLEKYTKAGKAKKAHGSVKRDKYTSLITSRGCPGRCIFCSVHCVWGHTWRARSPENVVAEIEQVVNRYGTSEIHFEDDNLTLNNERAKKICNLIIEKKLNISWMAPNGVAINRLDKELLTKMRKSGCYQLCFGLESGNESVRNKIVKKSIKYGQAKEVVKICKNLGIWTHGFFVIGLPGENLKTMNDSLEFAKKLDLDNADFFIASPYPGTELYDIAQAEGYLSSEGDFSKYRISIPIINTGEFSSEDLIKLRQQFYKNFVFYRIKREIIHASILKRLSKIKTFEDFQFLFRKALSIRKYI